MSRFNLKICALVFFSLSAGTALGDTITVRPPCVDPNRSKDSTDISQIGMPTCAEVLGGDGVSAGNRTTASGAANAGMLEVVRQTVATKIERMYKGPEKFGMTICSLSNNPVAKFEAEKQDFNHMRESCGLPMYIEIADDGKRIIMHQDLYKVQARPGQSPMPRGTLEDGYLNGAKVQAMSCFHGQVTSEIRNSNQIVVKDFAHSPSTCSALAKDYNDLDRAHASLMAELSKKASPAEMQKLLSSCRVDSGATKKGEAGSESPLVAQICTARQGLTSAFMDIASCEISGRANDSYLFEIGNVEPRKAMITWIQTRMKQQCIPITDSEDEANSCYYRGIQGKALGIAELMSQYFNNIWVQQGSDCQYRPTRSSAKTAPKGTKSTDSGFPESSPLFAMGLGLQMMVGRRKKRPSDRGSLRLGVGLALALAAGACQHPDQNTPVTLAPDQSGLICYDNAGGFHGPACCPNGPASYTASIAGCADGPGAGDKDITDDLNRGGGNNGVTRFAIDNAKDLLTNPSANLNPGPLVSAPATAGLDKISSGGIAEAAHAGGDTIAQGNSKALPGISGVGDSSNSAKAFQAKLGGAGLDSGSAAGGGGLGAGGAGGSLGAGGGAGGLAGSGAAKAGGTTGLNGDSGYAGGGGANGAAGGANALGKGSDGLNAFGLGGADGFGGDGHTGDEAGFAGLGDGTNPMGSEDPADYFTRLNLNDSIFKIVTNRYRAKTLAWANAAAPAPVLRAPAEAVASSKPAMKPKAGKKKK